MQTLPPAMLHLLAPFAPLFSARVWRRALVLVAGTLPAPDKRTVCAALRAMGLSQSKRWSGYHRVLNRARWSSLAVARVLLGLLVAAFAPAGPLVFGLDETIERRWGPQIAAKGLYRDAVRSSKEYFVKVSGRRRLCLLLLVPIPWAGRVWALPFLPLADWLAATERDDGHGLALRATVTARGMRSAQLHALFGFGSAALRPAGPGGIIDGASPRHAIARYAAQLLAEGDEVIAESPPERRAAIPQHLHAVAELYQRRWSSRSGGGDRGAPAQFVESRASGPR